MDVSLNKRISSSDPTKFNWCGIKNFNCETFPGHNDAAHDIKGIELKIYMYWLTATKARVGYNKFSLSLILAWSKLCGQHLHLLCVVDTCTSVMDDIVKEFGYIFMFSRKLYI